jgi:hypothetical protein
MKGINLLPHEIEAAKAGRLGLIVRVCKEQPPTNEYQLTTLMDTTSSQARKHIGMHQWAIVKGLDIIARHGSYFPCPFPVGATIYGREAWRYYNSWANRKFGELDGTHTVTILLKDGSEFKDIITTEQKRKLKAITDNWRSASTMPEWASRFSYLVTSAECRRVQEITIDEIKLAGYSHLSRIGYRYAFGSDWNQRAKSGQEWSDNPYAWFCRLEVKG